MAGRNVEPVRTAVEALNSRDIDTFVGCLHPDVEWEETADAFPGLSGTYRGPEEVRGWAEQAVVEFWAELEMQIEELTRVGGSAVLLGMRISALGTASGAATQTRAWQVIWLEEGQILRRRGPFWIRAEALKAAGLPR
jgi:ketosteroid isomerase-like protein